MLIGGLKSGGMLSSPTFSGTVTTASKFLAPGNAGAVYAFTGTTNSGLGHASGAPYLLYGGSAAAGVDPASSAWYSNNGYRINPTIAMISIVAPTISSGFGTSPSISSNNGSVAFIVNVGAGGTASSGVIGLPAAANGWIVMCNNISTTSGTVFMTKQTASTTTTATIGNFSDTGASAAWGANNLIACIAIAY